MNLKEQCYGTLVVSSADKLNEGLFPLLKNAGCSPVVLAKNVSAAKRAAAERSFDFVIINSPLPDDTGLRFAVDCASSRGALVLLLIKNEVRDETDERFSPYGIFTLGKPVLPQSMINALKWLKTVKAITGKYRRESTSIEKKMEEIRLVNRAKWLLIDNESLSEPEAHRKIEKEAMDRCITKAELAEEIIGKYEGRK